MINTVICGDALTVLKAMPDEFVNCCVTSPPYWGLRDYGHPDQLGLEKTPELYVQHMVEVFSLVRKLLRDDGTCWINLGDSYAGSMRGYGRDGSSCVVSEKQLSNKGSFVLPPDWDSIGLKPKDLCGIPWRVALALQADGWYLRSDIIWHKPNPMPESVTDRPTKSHEYIFLLSKSSRYYYDAETIKEPIKDSSMIRLLEPNLENQQGSFTPSKQNGKMKAVRFGGNKQCPDTRLQSGKGWQPTMAGGGTNIPGHAGYFKSDGSPFNGVMVNKKSVWTVATQGYKEAHFATFPPKLIEPCILAGCPEGGIVLDPFMGSGTTALVATLHRRNWIGIELNPAYCELVEKRRKVTPMMF